MGGGADLSILFNNKVCVFGFFSSWCGAWRGMDPVVSLSAGNLFYSPKMVDVLKKDFFFILSICSQLSTISLQGLSLSNRLNRSKVKAVDRSLRSLKGSTFASISQALVGVVFRPPHTNRSPLRPY